MANIAKPKSAQTKKYIPMTKATIIVISIVGALILMSASVLAYQTYIQNNDDHYTPNCGGIDDGVGACAAVKPVIYLYPTKTQDIKVELTYNGTLTSTYPDYDSLIHGWKVSANPDGSLTNYADNNQYSYIFWEGLDKYDYSKFDSGFIVKGSESKDFLQSSLSKIGLTPKEYNEMIVYWLPKMQDNKYNLIHFAGKEYTDNAKLTISPKPDSILRVFMVVKPLNKYQQIKPQPLESFKRHGFTVVEWGGTEI